MIKVFLDDNFNFALKPDTLVFSGGEVHIKMDLPEVFVKRATIVGTIHNSEELMEFFMVTDSLHRKYPGIAVHAEIPYFPYSRQDRVANAGEALSVSALAKLVNAQNYTSVTTMDDHSYAVGVALNNHKEVTQEYLVNSLADIREAIHGCGAIVSPDAGATKKTLAIGKVFDKPVIQGMKHRDTTTGEINNTTVSGDVPEHVVIIDDICDGGRTFIELAKVLRAQGAKKVDLFVTHGIFSKGMEVFEGHIDTIFTTNSFCRQQSGTEGTVELKVAHVV